MNIRLTLRLSFLLVFAGVAVGCSTKAEPTDVGDAASPCPWPDSLDAVVAAPGNHRLLLEAA